MLDFFSNHYNKSNIPVWLMRQAGRYLPEYREVRKKTDGFLDLCYNSNLAAEVTLQPLKRFNLDAAIIFSDILVTPDSMGIEVFFKEQEGPILNAIRTKKDLINRFNYKKIDILSNVYEAIDKVKKNLPLKTSLIGFSGGAWTLASYIVEGKLSKDFSVVKKTYYNDKEFFDFLIDNLIINISNHLINQVKAGVDFLQIFDSWAGMLGGDDYEQLVIIPTQKIIERVRKVFPSIPIICFPRMSGINYKNFCKKVKCDAISIDQYMPLDWIKKNNSQKIIQGNLDPIILLSDSKKLIKTRIDEILTKMEGRKLIFNLGHGVVPNTPIENVEFLVNYIKNNK